MPSWNKSIWRVEFKLKYTDSGFRFTSNSCASVFVFLILLSQILIYLLHKTGLENWVFIVRLSEFISNLIPSVNEFSALSVFPVTAKRFLAIVWGIYTPLFFLICLFTETQMQNLLRLKQWEIWGIPIGGIIICWMIINMPGGIDCTTDNLGKNRIFCLSGNSQFLFSAFYTAVILCTPCCIAVILKWPKIIYLYYSSKEE